MGNSVKQLKFINKDVPGAGTRVQLTTDNIFARSVTFQGDHDNTGSVFIGDNTVSSTVHALALDPGEKHTFNATVQGGDVCFNLSDFWIDVETNGNDIAVSYT